MDVVNSISCVLDCKVDIREKKFEFSLRSWSSYYVMVEAIKCFPCYIKISIFRDCSDSDTNSILRINIPGVQVLPAKSRTKQYSYGLFWKNNRKKCSAFFAFDSQFSAENHMNWMKTQIKNLEAYRLEILQSRRASRFKLEQSINTTATGEESIFYQNLDETSNIKDVNDILGPLPNIPESSIDPRRKSRLSGLSQIYEEIAEQPKRKSHCATRDSVSSGIYEEMRLPKCSENFGNTSASRLSSTPPPLPPRTRINTDCNLKRSYTTPESDYFTKKKSWNLFGGVFARSKKRDKRRNEMTKNRRNSFSSPDLSHLYCGEDAETVEVDVDSDDLNSSFDVHHRKSSNSSESSNFALERLYENDEIEQINEEKQSGQQLKETVIYEVPKSLNISHDITQNFDITMNSDVSRINLVGNFCRVEENRVSPTPKYDKVPPGYMEMTSGRGFDREKVKELDQNLQNKQSPDFFKIEYQFNSPINFKRGTDVAVYDNLKRPVNEQIYVNMESPKKLQKSNQFVFNDEFAKKCEEKAEMKRNSVEIPEIEVVLTPDYDKSSLEFVDSSSALQRKLDDSLIENFENLNTSQNECRKVSNRNSADEERIASYLPNFENKTKKTHKKHVRSATADGAIISEQRKLLLTPQSQNSKKVTSKSLKKNSKKDDQENYHSDDPEVKKSGEIDLNKKYATIARLNSSNAKSSISLTSNNNIPSSGAVTRKLIDFTGTTKRFGSLPRFKKLDFSPLRMKISSVLQRYNPDSL